MTLDIFESIIKTLSNKCVPSLSGNSYKLEVLEKENKKANKKAVSTKKKCVLNIKSACTSQDELHMFLYLYKLLKNERNLFNHFSDKYKRAEKNDIIMAIELFLKLGKKLYGELPDIAQAE